ncbi:MAG: hypothetical protein UU37_C0005G0013 [Candidatus Gottesmanbacteria bacterium GW2011_GWA2_41_12]|uniref:Uncharacterized protein n=1 Tax=Candidatus Gottesmanbacteria bacterium GW2011_GWA2_41_12 TaxID=1618440 RepID=A0A0G0XKZ9_9BACT|nr:MAG: hypothetical protein UU37_C0005G0013 [Candidatus Gottesmanbacteria bacterium GW2011_GWA2_41_12]
MSDQPVTGPIKASTQEFLEIEDIKDDMLILKDGSAAIVLETSAVNFGLLSEEEQEALIYSYAAFLNSLSFPLQIVILSKKMDISTYLALVEYEEKKQMNPLIKTQLTRYREFVLSIVKENKVLEKKFYLVLPFSCLELGVKGAFPMFGSKKSGLPFPKEYIIQRAKTALFPKKDHVIRQLGRLGLRAKELSSQELVELFYNIFNQTQTGGQKLGEATGYTQPLVQSIGVK